MFDDKIAALFLLRRAKYQGLSSEALALLLDDQDRGHSRTDWTEIKRRLEELLSPS
ncbi:MAG: hypothetical protein ACU84Q_05520 [Gammaproteobacteria bacterium]